MYCGDPRNISTIVITSAGQVWGNWGTVYSCRSDDRPVPPDGFVTGFELRVERDQGSSDDTATNNLRILCSYPPSIGVPEQQKEGDGLAYGGWTGSQRCFSYQAICALQTQVERDLGDGEKLRLYLQCNSLGYL